MLIAFSHPENNPLLLNIVNEAMIRQPETVLKTILEILANNGKGKTEVKASDYTLPMDLLDAFKFNIKYDPNIYVDLKSMLKGTTT